MRPGRAIGSVIWRKVARRPAPEVLRRLDERPVHALEGHVEREDHQRQVAVDEPEEDREVRAEDPERLVPGQTSTNQPARPSRPRRISHE